ncbi:invasion associated locus B family protein [Bosea sp. NBC_00550]|uniref:invasion associated locus B family protein n=1 Tax=Bosea sp. NBC_00550 TaxID=2969621 RepID=UPI00222F90E4|nr:invasion associated locus B family protein [Bosea sp. NBC_00550]UZF93431.1 invasion associated locus B family protein [Bosea sp. NBC_00550]
MILGLATLGVVVASIGSGFAQNGPAKPAAAPPAAPPSIPAVSSEPTVTTASFGDWTLRCQRIVDAARAARVCEVAQVLQAQGQQAPLAQVALGRLANGEPVRITAVMPASVSFPSSVQIFMGEKDAKPVDLPWRRCLPTGCFADVVPGDDVLKQWRKATEQGRILFKDAAGRELALPLSSRGLDQALDALAKERL